MGAIVVEIALENRDDRANFSRGLIAEADIRAVQVPGLVDTGASMLALPAPIVEQLGLDLLETFPAVSADGRREPLDTAGPVFITIGDRRMLTECFVLPQGAEPLIGQIVLERLDLIADSRLQTLSPRPESPDYPLLRV